MKKSVGVAVLGLGWMGQAHSRSMLRIPSLFPDRNVTPRLVVCADTEESGARVRLRTSGSSVRLRIGVKPSMPTTLMLCGSPHPTCCTFR